MENDDNKDQNQKDKETNLLWTLMEEYIGHDKVSI